MLSHTHLLGLAPLLIVLCPQPLAAQGLVLREFWEVLLREEAPLAKEVTAFEEAEANASRSEREPLPAAAEAKPSTALQTTRLPTKRGPVKEVEPVTVTWLEVEPALQRVRSSQQHMQDVSARVTVVPLARSANYPFAVRLAQQEAPAKLRAVAREVLQASDTEALTSDRLRQLLESTHIERMQLELTQDKVAYRIEYESNHQTTELRVEVERDDLLDIVFDMADLANHECEIILERCAEKAGTQSGLAWTHRHPRPSNAHSSGSDLLLEAFHFPVACREVLQNLQRSGHDTINCDAGASARTTRVHP